MKKYKIIYIDPPWQYKTYSQKGDIRSPERHYHTMRIENIADLRVKEISDSDCVMFMWATFPCLLDAIKLGELYGFRYKTVAFTWVKMNKNKIDPFLGMGYYTRANAEICLLFTKGKPLKRINKDVPQVGLLPIGRHSQKPSEFRNRIVRLFGDVTRVEIFARERCGMFGMDEYAGWDVFGNEISNSIVI